MATYIFPDSCDLPSHFVVLRLNCFDNSIYSLTEYGAVSHAATFFHSGPDSSPYCVGCWVPKDIPQGLLNNALLNPHREEHLSRLAQYQTWSFESRWRNVGRITQPKTVTYQDPSAIRALLDYISSKQACSPITSFIGDDPPYAYFTYAQELGFMLDCEKDSSLIEIVKTLRATDYVNFDATVVIVIAGSNGAREIAHQFGVACATSPSCTVYMLIESCYLDTDLIPQIYSRVYEVSPRISIKLTPLGGADYYIVETKRTPDTHFKILPLKTRVALTRAMDSI
jgi:hypothetical protein